MSTNAWWNGHLHNMTVFAVHAVTIFFWAKSWRFSFVQTKHSFTLRTRYVKWIESTSRLTFFRSDITTLANFPSEVVESLPADFGSGIYYGWATVDDGPIHKMVMSVGWNPHFKNTRRSMVSGFLLRSVSCKWKFFHPPDLAICSTSKAGQSPGQIDSSPHIRWCASWNFGVFIDILFESLKSELQWQ